MLILKKHRDIQREISLVYGDYALICKGGTLLRKTIVNDFAIM